MSTRGRVALLLGAVVALALVTTASAGKPTIARIVVNETVPDPFLTAECGVPVTLHSEGHVIVRTFSGGGAGPAEISTINILNTVSAGDNSYRVRDVGADHVQIRPDGTPILMIIGQVPFGFTGVLKLNLDTEEAILEPHHSLESQVDDACAALTA